PTPEIYTLSLHDALPISQELGQPITAFVEDADPRERLRVWFHTGKHAVAFSEQGLLAVAHTLWTEGRAGHGVSLSLKCGEETVVDRKSTRLNSSHVKISY